MTIIGPAEITQTGATVAVLPSAADPTAPTGHSIEPMRDEPLPGLHLPAQVAFDPDTRPWAHERVLGLVQARVVAIDNRGRKWRHQPGLVLSNTADYLERRLVCALHQLAEAGYVTVAPAKTDMPAPDCRTLRIRRYQLTATGRDLLARWARLAAYTA